MIDLLAHGVVGGAGKGSMVAKASIKTMRFAFGYIGITRPVTNALKMST